ncbi:MAG: hypothetical protein ACYC6A_06155 [Armatimonadota bacterium]
MRQMMVILLTVALVGIFVASAFAAGRGGGKGQGQGKRNGACRLEQAEVVALEGTVTELVLPEPGQQRGQRQQGQRGPARFTLEGKDKQLVHLGPPFYLAEIELALKDGDTVKVNGWKMTVDKETFVVAREVIAAEKTYTLRQEDGTPAWTPRGGGRGQGCGQGRCQRQGR